VQQSNFAAAYVAENVNITQAKSSQTTKFRPIWSHCSAVECWKYFKNNKIVDLLPSLGKV
jgi:hypothetical protein